MYHEKLPITCNRISRLPRSRFLKISLMPYLSLAILVGSSIGLPLRVRHNTRFTISRYRPLRGILETWTLDYFLFKKLYKFATRICLLSLNELDISITGYFSYKLRKLSIHSGHVQGFKNGLQNIVKKDPCRTNQNS